MTTTDLDRFASEDARTFSWRFESYRLGHSELYINVSDINGKHLYYILFANVKFVSSPTQGIGANFEVGTEKECKQILYDIYDMYHMGIGKQLVDNLFANNMPKLYYIPNSKLGIRIVAGGMERVKKII